MQHIAAKLLDAARLVSLPLVAAYSVAVRLRNLFFDKGIFRQQKVQATVFSVGNITVGGSGKTPFVIFLTNYLKQLDQFVGVLSRGYGRLSHGYQLVSDGQSMKTDVLTSGDEMYYTARECQVPAAVCEKRVEGAQKLIQQTGCKVLVLDDAYQHRWIARDCDILLLDQRFLVQERKLRQLLLPTGNLREPMRGIDRADCVVLNRKFSEQQHQAADMVKPYLKQGAELFTASYQAIGFIDVRNDRYYPAADFNGQKSLLVSGVAYPHSFVTALNGLGIDTSDKLVFMDHKTYTIEEVQLIRKEFYGRNSQSVITTQKDAVKLMDFRNELDDIDIYYLKIEVVMDDMPAFSRFINKYVNKTNELS